MTNLNGGASDSVQITGGVALGQTQDIEFNVGNERVVLTIDGSFDVLTPISTDTITGNVDTSGFGVGAFGTITVTGTSGNVSTIDRNIIETSGTATNATLTLSSTDGDFIASGVDLSVSSSTVPVVLTNATTGATISLQIDVTTGLNDAAIASNLTEIQLNNFLRNVAATNGTINAAEVRPGDTGYDPQKPSFYRGDESALTVRIDINATLEYGITAKEPGFEKLFRALFLAKNANVQSGEIDRDTLEQALGLTLEAIKDIPDIRSKIGSDRLALEKAKSRHQDFVLFTEQSISQIEDIDVAAAVARIGIEQAQLEASYLVTTRLSRLSLVNFLR